MSDQTSNFVGGIPEHYDRGMGPIVFAASPTTSRVG